ncbi:hypothetical protein ACJIZ3_004279 [Penstemon smallii]|uniref:Pentatricopeptide repeat-containing protein n=1 Tax=Penstemon smallii TaxID=265156 RepID=A0ABD3S1L3_9LAMI
MQPNSVVYNILISAYYRIGDVVEATYSSPMHGMRNIGQVDELKNLLDDMRKEGNMKEAYEQLSESHVCWREYSPFYMFRKATKQSELADSDAYSAAVALVIYPSRSIWIFW